jgi:hypothetical protein
MLLSLVCVHAGIDAWAQDTGGPGEPPTEGGTAQAMSSKMDDMAKKIEELEAQISELKTKVSKKELDELKEAAEQEAEEEVEEEAEPASFKSGARALQAQNPEISLTGDFLVTLWGNGDFRKPYPPHQEGGEEEHHHTGVPELSGFSLRAVELNVQANLDPFSFAKAVIGMSGEGVEVEEGYMTWTGIAPRLSLTVGRFRQQFGVINRWHAHALDQVDAPRSIMAFFGGHGLAQTGLSLHVLLPAWWAHAIELTLQVTNAENEHLFAGEFWSVPTALGHLKNYWDASDATYVELGLSGLWGFNNRRSFLVEDEVTGEVHKADEPWRNTVVAGADFTVSWVPPQKSKYLGVTWRTEAMYMRKETAEGDINAFGGFTYLDIRVSQTFILGARLDAGQKPELGDEREFVQASPYMTFWQSEFVYLRLQYNYLWQNGGYEPEHVALLQIDFSLGPHKHEKY